MLYSSELEQRSSGWPLFINGLRLLQLFGKYVLWFVVIGFGFIRAHSFWHFTLAIVGGATCFPFVLWRLWKAWRLKSLLSYQWHSSVYDLVAICLFKALYFDTYLPAPGWMVTLEHIQAISYFSYILIPTILLGYLTYINCYQNSKQVRISSRKRPGWIMVLLFLHYLCLILLFSLAVAFNLSTLFFFYTFSLHYIVYISNIVDLGDIVLNIFQDLGIRRLKQLDHPYAMYTEMREQLLNTSI